MKTHQRSLRIALFFLFFCISGGQYVYSQYGGGIINTYAGKGNPPADPGITSLDVAIDASGNIYFSDPAKFIVYRISSGTTMPVAFAGTGVAGYSGDGGQATSAKIGTVYLAVDISGNVYLSDTGYRVIRKVTASTGIITTIAGTGAAGSSGDGGPALSATFMRPQGLAVDAAGNVYVADFNGNKVRKITIATGIISTVAGKGTPGLSGDGGPATSAKLTQPSNVSFDASGNLYISCTGNSRIREVTIATGKISTVAGTVSGASSGDGASAVAATFSLANYVSLDASGNMYISDGDRVRKVSASTGIINTIAGNGVMGCYGDGSLAVNARIAGPNGLAVSNTGTVYITQTQYQTLRMINQSTGIINIGCYVVPGLPFSDIGDGGPATSAQLNAPRDVAVDANGNVYIVDGINQRVRKVDANTRAVQTIAGGGEVGFYGDGGPAKYAMFNDPAGICLDNAGNIYIADRYNNRIRKIDGTTGVISTVAGNGTAGLSGMGGPATSANIDRPQDVLVDAAGNLFISSAFNNAIFKVTAGTGIINIYAGTGTPGFSGDGGVATAATFFGPYGLTFDGFGNLVICDKFNYRLRKVDHATNIVTTIAGTGAAGASGDGGPAMVATVNLPDALALDPAGNIMIADLANNKVRLIEKTSTNIYPVAGTGSAGFSGDGGPALNAELNSISGVAIVPGSGLTFIADGNNNRIRSFTTPYIIPVPLKLLAFQVTRQSHNALLSWTTASEDGSSYFQIERSEDGVSFNAIGSVPAIGQNEKNNTYTFNDQPGETKSLVVYYRLRMVDIDGKYTYSKTAILFLGGAKSASTGVVYPSPFISTLSIQTGITRERSVYIRIYDNSGKQLYSKKMYLAKGESIIQLHDLTSIPAGIHFLEITDDNEKLIQKIVKLQN